MLGYQPPKSRCWGHIIRTKEPHLLREKFDAFFAIYFEQAEQTKDGTLLLTWKQSALPHVEWTDEYFKPELQRFQKQMVILMLNRVMFMMGLIFPISATDPATYKFLARFNADAPFKMSPQFFKVGTNGKPGKTKWTKPDAAVAAHLQKALG